MTDFSTKINIYLLYYYYNTPHFVHIIYVITECFTITQTITTLTTARLNSIKIYICRQPNFEKEKKNPKYKLPPLQCRR